MSTEFFNDQWRIPSNENQNKISNYSMDFDGTSAEIDLGTSPSALIGAMNPYSVSAWVYVAQSDLASGNYFILGAQDGIDRWYFRIQAGYARFAYGGLIDNTTLTPITGDQWNHVVFTFEGGISGDFITYVNGVSKSTVTNSVIQGIPNFNIFIGALGVNTATGINHFKGKIDQTTIFNYALSQDQVTQLGAEGYAFNFNGSNQFVNISNPISLPNDFTIAAWIYPTRVNDSYEMIYTQGTSIYAVPPYFAVRDTMLHVYITGVYQTGLNFITANEWQHVAVTRTSGVLNLYRNGIEYNGSRPTQNGTINTGLPGRIGKWYNTAHAFKGQMSNVQTFNTALPATGSDSIVTLYNSGKPLPDMSSFTSLQGWWKLNDTATFNSGTSVWSIPDASTNSNTGTSSGMDASSLVVSNIDGELISNPMALSPKPVAYYQLGDQSVSTGPTSDYLVPNNSLSDYVFDFNTDRINISSSGGSFLNGATKLTVSIWVNLDASTGPDFFQVFAGNWVNPGWQFRLQFIRYGSSLGPRIQFSVRSGGGSGTAQRSFDPAGVGWFNITGTWDGSLVKVYTDGMVGGTSAALTGTINNSNETIELGGEAGGSNNLNGKLSNVAIWKNTALTQPEVTEVYNNGAPLNLNNFSGSAPAAWYKLNASEIFNNTSTEWSIDNNAYPSVYKSSLDFTTNDYINCGSSSSLTINGDLTLSAWINIDANPGGFYGIISKRTSATVRNYEVLINSSGKVGIYVANGGVATSTVFDSVIPINTWVSIVITIQSGVTNGAKLFLNGSQDAITGTQSISADAADFLIGARGPASSPSSYINGSISNVSIFNTALSTPNVQTLYNNGTPQASISSSPVSWWKLDNTTTGLLDSGSASNNGTNSGATEYAGFVNALASESVGMDSSNLVVSDLQQTSGYSPYALDFDGTDDFLNCGNDSSLQITGAMTVSYWFKGQSATASATGVGKLNNSPNRGFMLGRTNGNEIYFFIAPTASSLVSAIATPTLSNTQWYHLAAVYTPSTSMVIYLNGTPIQTLTTGVPASQYNGSNNLQIGNRGDSSKYFNGEISNVAIWNTNLSATKITEIYNEGVPSNLNTFSGTAPIAWWQIGSNSSFNPNPTGTEGTWTCLDEAGTNNATSSNSMTNDAITDGPGYSGSGLGSSTIDIVGDAPYSTANGLSENMDVLDRVSGAGNVPG